MVNVNIDSILDSIKKNLGIDSSLEYFDPDIALYVNSALGTLYQLGVIPDEGFEVITSNQKWSDLSIDNIAILSGIKNYVYLKTRLLLDPPSTSFGISALKEQAEELEWRLCSMAENG